MATLVLTAVGTAIGGPIGGAIGALVGQAADAVIFRPKGREGPRLADLRVQTSTYGTRIPRLHGRLRVAGTVIWSTDLLERSETSRSGKGQPSLTQYSYSASFAVALSSRPVRSVGRIWADGNLLRGAAGDFKSPLGAFRLHSGGEEQLPDPLIVAALGADHASAHKGLAYAVFEELDLSDFGNRIPTLTFEMVADEDDVLVEQIAASALNIPVQAEGLVPLLPLTGYACDAGDAREALAPLMEVFGLRYRESESVGMTLSRGHALAATIAQRDQIRRVDGESVEPCELARRSAEDVPARISLRYYDPARDYQAGVQSVDRPGVGEAALTVDFPATLTADMARQMAGERLRAAMEGRATAALSLGWQALEWAIGAIISLEGLPGRWLVESIEWVDMVARVTLTSIPIGARIDAGTGASGMNLPSPDRLIGPTVLTMVELPPDGSKAQEAPLIMAAATGVEAGWRGAALYRMDGELAVPFGAIPRRTIIGNALGVLPVGESATIDCASNVVVELARSGDQLDRADDAGVARGANRCMLGRELLQFGDVEALGGNQFRLSRLMRGLGGTEWAMGRHAAGDSFVMLDGGNLFPLEVEASSRGHPLMVQAVGRGDNEAVTAGLDVMGLAMMPLSPVHLQTYEQPNGDLRVSWVRRSRTGLQWLDGGDVPLGEETERYAVSILSGGIELRISAISSPLWTYHAADRAADLTIAGSNPMIIRVVQIGTWGLGDLPPPSGPTGLLVH